MKPHEKPEYKRLLKAGLWRAANAFREVERKRLRAEGFDSEYALDESWKLMLAEFPSQEKQPADAVEEDEPEEDESPPEPAGIQESYAAELTQLALATAGNPTDADGDIDFAYRNMALPTVTPLMAPSISAWSWYLYSRSEPNKFLEICAKREDAKAKMAGTITNQRMEDDKRQQFAVIDRIEKALTLNVAATIKELMEKFPEDVLRECRKFDAEWKAFLAKEPG